ncbi:MAG: hypothetical protein ACXQTV_03515 [Candidatus Hecatellaceae archaeon]
MVLAGKVFRLAERLGFGEVEKRLKGYRREEAFKEEGYDLQLLTEVERLSRTNLGLEGVISYDKVLWLPRRGEMVPVVRTYTAPFLFTPRGNQVLLTVVEKKHRADRLADLFSEILFGGVGGVLEVRIPPENLQRYHEDNPEGTKVVFFEDLDFPGIEKLSLYGESLSSTSAYSDMLGHGKIWYVVVTSKRYGYVVGVTGNGIVTVFSRIEVEDFFRYVVEEVFPLISL